MKNNKGFGTKEILIVIVLILGVTAYLMTNILGGASKQRISTFRQDALKFSQDITINISSFSKVEVVYLQEAIDEQVSKKIKNPLGSGYCDPTLSKVEFHDGKSYTTLQCGKYLIDNADITYLEKLPVYEVSEWSDKKPELEDGEELETRVFYNCYEGKKYTFDDYYEEQYLIYRFKKDIDQNIRSLNSITKNTAYEVKEKTMYRTKKEVKVKD